MDEVKPEMLEAVSKALEAWKALPDDERFGERPFIMGFNAGWEECEAQRPQPSGDEIERVKAAMVGYTLDCEGAARAALAAMDREPIAVGDHSDRLARRMGAEFVAREPAEQSAADRVKALEGALRNARYSLEYWERECRVAGKNPKWAVGPYERGLQEIDRSRQVLEGR